MSTSTENTVASEEIQAELVRFVAGQTKTTVKTDLDLFGSGLVSSLFALQLVVHVETAFGVAVQGSDLKIDNFRTIEAITALVLRLRGDGHG